MKEKAREWRERNLALCNVNCFSICQIFRENITKEIAK